MAKLGKELKESLQEAVDSHSLTGNHPFISTGKFARTAIFGGGVDLLGSKMSLAASKANGSTLEICEGGIKATSGKNGREVCIPWAYVKCFETLK